MITKPPLLLLCTNGCETTVPALEYGVWMAGLLKTSVNLLGVVETAGMRPEVERLVEETRQQLETHEIPHQVEFDDGRGSLVIAEHAGEQNYLTVVGPLGRPAWRRIVQGRSFRRMLSKIETPILYVPKKRIPIEKMLLCMGGLGYAEGIEHILFYLAKAAGARVTILHVIEPITLDYPTAQKVQEHRESLIQTDTPQGRSLRSALADAQKAGLVTDVRIREGNAVMEIDEEVRSGDYDMIGLGSPYSTQSLRHLYMPNVTAEVAEAVNRPVLVARLGHKLIEG